MPITTNACPATVTAAAGNPTMADASVAGLGSFADWDCRLRAGATIARHGRTFNLARYFLAGASADSAIKLYALLRAIDDAVDGPGPAEEKRAVLGAVQRQLDGDGWISAVAGDRPWSTIERASVRAAMQSFLQTAATDLDTVALKTRQQLIDYAYGVAGTVGLMMCPILGVTDGPARACAANLGIAMQLTNIARDVVEDAGLGRCYIPTEGNEPAFTDILQVLELADGYYRRAALGYRHIPRRNRLAIMIAARTYRRIGDVIRRRGARRYFMRRAVVSPLEKLWCVTRATMGFIRHLSETAHPAIPFQSSLLRHRSSDVGA